MKKVLFSLLSSAALLCSTSCSDEAVVSPEVGGEAMVNFTVELNDGNASRAAISDGKKATELYYEVYSVVDGKYTLLEAHDNWQNDEDAGEPIAIVDGKAKVGFALVKGQTYDVVFWAQKPGAYDAKNLQNINVSSIANNEDKDAFTAVHHIQKVDGAKSETVTLTRPFAQVNFGAPQTDIDDAIAAGVVFGEGDDRLQSRITVKSAALSFNALTGFSNERSEQCVAQVFGWNKIPSFDEKIMTIGEGVDAVDYRYLATAYVLVPETNQGVADLKLELETGLNEIITLEVPAAPVQRNYRTNVIGNLLTNQTDFTVIVNPIYAGEETVNIWDGSSITEPKADVNNVYHITTAAELIGMMNDSKYPNCNKYQNVVLDNDIDLGGYTVKGFGDDSGFFDGVFDGQGHTISNFVIDATSRKYYAGLFNQVSQYSGENTVIKNLTVRNATVSGTSQVGVIAGGANGNTVVENCKVYDCTVKAAKKVASVIGYTAGGTVKNCYAENCTVIYTEKEAGEVLGYENTGSTVENNTFKNITFKPTCEALTLELTPDANDVINITRNYVVVGDWTSLNVSNVTINGNGHFIKKINQPFIKGVSGKNITINGLTIADSNVGVGYENGLATGAFVSFIDYAGSATFNDCHLINSSVTGNERAAGLLGYASNTAISINNCSVVGCEITSVGGSAGFVGYYTGTANIENSKVENSIVEATEDRTGKKALAGTVIGTVNGPATINNVTSTGNTVINYGATGVSEMFGRILSTINGQTYVATWDEFTAAVNAGETDILLMDNITYEGNYSLKKNVTIDLNSKSITMPMFYVFSTATIKNGNIIGKMYARTGCKATLEGLTFSGTISDNLSTEGHLQVQGSCDVYAKNCTFAATTVNGSQTRSLSIEASSSGIRKFEGCDFKFVSWGNGAGKYKKNVYINTMNGTTTVDFTDCKLNGKAPNIIFAAAYPLTNLTMSGCDNTAPTLEINRAKDTVTEVEWAHISSLIANNKFTQVRVFYAGGSSEYIR